MSSPLKREDGVEIRVDSDEDQVQTHFNITSPLEREDGVEIRVDSDEDQVQTHFNITSPLEREDGVEIRVDSDEDQVQAHVNITSPLEREDGVEIRVDSDEDQVQTHFNITSPPERTARFEARDGNSIMQETDVFVRRTGLLDSPIREVDRGSMGSPQAEECPAGGARSSVQAREELPSHVTNKASSSRVRSPGLAETSGSGLSSKVPRRTRGKQEFYIAVPPPSEWVLRA